MTFYSEKMRFNTFKDLFHISKTKHRVKLHLLNVIDFENLFLKQNKIRFDDFFVMFDSFASFDINFFGKMFQGMRKCKHFINKRN